MFDRIALVAPTRHVTEHVHVTEKRAPTDESVRLLKEYEEKADARRLDAIKVGDSSFECVIHTERDAASGDVLWRAIFSLNGKKLRADHRARYGAGSQDEHMTALRDAVAKKIATEVLVAALSKMPQLRFTA